MNTVRQDPYFPTISNWIHLGNSNKWNPFSSYRFYSDVHPTKKGITVVLPFVPDWKWLISKHCNSATKWAYFRILKDTK